MQDFISQASKNGIVLVDHGVCQFCGAAYDRGVFECMDNYNNGLQLINFSNPENHLYTFLSVDAHALQHPEIHGRWSNHFHLTRLNLILDEKIKWSYKTSPFLSNYLNEYKLNRSQEFLISPPALARGLITTKNFLQITEVEACKRLIKSWAEEVYEAWKENHSIVSSIAKGFLEKNNNLLSEHKNTSTH